MKIQILVRFEPLSDWYEIYINGTLIYNGERPLDTLILDWLKNNSDLEIEIREFTIPSSSEDDYNPPLFSMTGENYWGDWEKTSDNLFDNS